MSKCTACGREFSATYLANGKPHKCCAACREKSREHRARVAERDPGGLAAYQRQLRRTARERAIAAYGGECACCGEAHYEFLTIDHPNGGGRAEREGLKMWGNSFAAHLVREGFPPGYRVLCHNCNSSLGYHGYCPHDS